MFNYFYYIITLINYLSCFYLCRNNMKNMFMDNFSDQRVQTSGQDPPGSRVPTRPEKYKYYVKKYT